MSEEIKKYLDSANFKFKDVDDKGNEIELTLSEMIENLVENNKKLGTYINNLQQKIDKAIEYIQNKKQFQQGCDTYQIIDWNYVLKILGDGNNE